MKVITLLIVSAALLILAVMCGVGALFVTVGGAVKLLQLHPWQATIRFVYVALLIFVVWASVKGASKALDAITTE